MRPLAEQGNALAELGLGVMYANGQGVPQDYAQAMVWYLKAAEQGDADAQALVGVMYVNGHGVPQDYTQALIWYRKAADQGNGQAQFGLGLIYANGHGVPQDLFALICGSALPLQQAHRTSRFEKRSSGAILSQPA